MIIELVGLPGAGKTTIARALIDQGAHDARSLTAREVLVGALQFALRRPLTSIRILAAIAMHAPQSMRYSLFMNGYAHTAATYMRARAHSRSGQVVIDQGFAQLLIMLPGLPASAARIFPKPDLLVCVYAPAVLRKERMHARGRVPRTEIAGSERWEQEAETAFNRAQPIFARAYPRMIAVSGEGDVARVADMLMSHASLRVAPRASLTKRLALWFAVLFTGGAHSADPAVLMYHAVDTSGWKLSIPPHEFERQMAYLHSRYTPVRLIDVVAHARGEKRLAPGSVAVTFDDGYADMVATVLPILKKYEIPATLFLTTDTELSTSPYGLPRITWEDVQALRDSGLVTIESHGHTHPRLSRLSTQDIVAELTKAANDIEEHIGYRPRYFAYPYGDRTIVVEEMTRASGYEASFSIREGFVAFNDELDHLPRIQVDRTMPFGMFSARLTKALTVNRATVNFFRSHDAA